MSTWFCLYMVCPFVYLFRFVFYFFIRQFNRLHTPPPAVGVEKCTHLKRRPRGAGAPRLVAGGLEPGMAVQRVQLGTPHHTHISSHLVREASRDEVL
jgi:hypothetical protein